MPTERINQIIQFRTSCLSSSRIVSTTKITGLSFFVNREVGRREIFERLSIALAISGEGEMDGRHDAHYPADS